MPPVGEALRELLAFLATQHVDDMVMGDLAVRVHRLGVTARLAEALRDAGREA